jgi:phage tail-like protein
MPQPDPFSDFRFRVSWDGQPVHGVTRVTALKRTTEVLSHREGGEPSTVHRSPGEITYAPILLERDRTVDNVFEQWAELVLDQGGDFRKEVRLELLDEAAQVVLAYVIHRCWPSEYQPIGDLQATNRAFAVESLLLQHEGWRRL